LAARDIIGSALLLGLFAVAGTGLVAYTHEATRDRIAANERDALLRSLHAVVDPARHDNDIFLDVTHVTAPTLLGTREPVAVYRARLAGEPVAAVLASVAPDGYSGTIRLLVAVNYDGTVGGVRVLAHRETPGLGDQIEESRSDWILRFAGRSLTDPAEVRWRVRKDGGVFDQFTGATITPRAVVQAIRHTLLYFEAHRDELFADTPGPAPEPAKAHSADDSEDPAT
jgi:Na+-translocating ferredoxin:NAD+ oxidoreductase subunit G